MPNLKDYLYADIQNTFFNSREFATEVIIDQVPTMVMKDDEQLQNYNLKSAAEGLAVGKILFYAKKDDFDKKIFIGKPMVFDNKHYKILDLKENFGVFTVVLEGYQS
ncbi:hypothetical protein [Neobacillus mesonae]|uniref:hypothetical protein n=1 Tax=Neobacillus mesonae TaxID=1193713 RepID=UPI00203FB67B|nr:hypothetical protein [Neobacillus mesonae]MCM3567855.1 hypothetical protein [Neobacillus mesonae]